MRLSEFWSAVDDVFGTTYGRSLTADLYLTAVAGTARDAIERGVDPDLVWEALVTETGQGPEARWIHRIDPKERTR